MQHPPYSSCTKCDHLKSPNKANIKFIVHLKEGTIANMMVRLADEIIHKRTAMPRVIIFARTYDA